MTNGEFVSSILNDGKLLNKDTMLSRRYILAKGRGIADTYIAQRLDSMDISQQYDIVSSIECFELVPVEGIKCGVVDLVSCKRIMKSKKKLPKLVNGRLGVAILSVTSLDGEYIFKQTSSKGFANKLKSKYTRDTEAYYIVQDNHLILPNSEVEYVRIELITLHKEDVEDCDCDGNKDECKTAWESEFVCPSNIFTMVRDKTIQEVASLTLQVRADENPDLDENTRSSTIA